MVSMGVTSVSEAGWGARSPDMQGEGLIWRADGMSWLVGGKDRGSHTGGRLWWVKTGEFRHRGVGDPMLEEPGAAVKAGLASSAAGPHAGGWEGPPPPAAFVRGPQTGFCWKPGSQAAAGAGARLSVAPAVPGAGAEAGAEGLGGRVDRPALPDPGEEARVGKVNGAGGHEWEGGPGRGWDRGERGPGEPCRPPDQGCAEEAPPADARVSTGAGEADSLWYLSGRGALPGAGGSAGAGKGPQGCRAGVSSRSALLMRRNAAAFSASRSSAVTRKPSSGGGGSLSGSPRLRRSRGNLRLPGLGLSDVGAPIFQVRFCPLVASASSSDRLLLWEATGAAQGGSRPPSLAFLEDLRGSSLRGMPGPVLLRPGGKPRQEEL